MIYFANLTFKEVQSAKDTHNKMQKMCSEN